MATRARGNAGEAVPVQDDSREKLMARHCGLVHDERRNGFADAVDADAAHPFELKSTTVEGVSTARDVRIDTVEDWRRKYWIVAKGTNSRSGFRIREIYACHPADLEPFFAEQEAKIRAGLDACEAVFRAAQRGDVRAKFLERARQVAIRGTTLNNPKVPLPLVREVGVDLGLDPEVAGERLRRFVEERPLVGAGQDGVACAMKQLTLFAA